jgi:hypothetical protein
MTTKVHSRSAGADRSPFGEYELETALVKERVSGPESLTAEERAMLNAFHGGAQATDAR